MEELIESLRRLATEGGDGNFLIIEFGMNYYIQFAQQKGSPEIFCEAVSNAYLETDDQLDSIAQDKLVSLGWSKYSAGANHNFISQNVNLEDQTRLAHLIIKTASEAYECNRLVIKMLNLE